MIPTSMKHVETQAIVNPQPQHVQVLDGRLDINAAPLIPRPITPIPPRMELCNTCGYQGKLVLNHHPLIPAKHNLSIKCIAIYTCTTGAYEHRVPISDIPTHGPCTQ
jgi:hypothetical protein